MNEQVIAGLFVALKNATSNSAKKRIASAIRIETAHCIGLVFSHKNRPSVNMTNLEVDTYKNEGKIYAVKLYKARNNCSLMEAKRQVENQMVNTPRY